MKEDEIAYILWFNSKIQLIIFIKKCAAADNCKYFYETKYHVYASWTGQSAYSLYPFGNKAINGLEITSKFILVMVSSNKNRA